MATPVIEEAAIKWPNSPITALCLPQHKALLEHHPGLADIKSFSKFSFEPLDFDIGILLPNSFSSAWHFYRARIPRRIGYAKDFRSFLLTDPITPSDLEGKEHLVDTYKRLLGNPYSASEPSLYIRAEEKKLARARLKKLGIPKTATIVGVHPTAAFGGAKRYPAERFQAIMNRFEDLYFLVFSDSAGQATVQDICQSMPANVINLAGKTTIRELMALISCCQLFLTNDSGPMHIASAFKVPVLALFGSTNPVATGPYRQGEIIYKKVPCSPCYRKECPIDFRCMLNIQVDEVCDKMATMLRASQSNKLGCSD